MVTTKRERGGNVNTKRMNQRGGALLITIAVMLMLTVAALIAINTANTDIDLSFNQLHHDRAFYVAEAGIQRAHAQLIEDNYWTTGYSDVAFEGGHYSVKLIDSSTNAALDDTVILRSTGSQDKANAMVEAWLVPEYRYPFRYAMFARDSINMDQQTCTDSYNSDSGSYAATVDDSLGDIGSNGTITTAKQVTIGGNAQSATPGGISLGVANVVTGDTSTTMDSVDLDIVPDSEFVWAKTVSVAADSMTGTGYTYSNGTRDLTGGAYADIVLGSGVYFFNDIELGQESHITLVPGASVTIYVTGDIILHQGSTINDGGLPSNFIVYSKGSRLQFDQDNVFCGAFYGPDAQIQYDQTTQVYGSLIGADIKLDKYACFHYDRGLAKVKHSRTGDMIMVAWREM
jgi:Tfp pilus assembly protein PilX